MSKIGPGDEATPSESDLLELGDDRLLLILFATTLVCLLMGAVLVALWNPIATVLLLTLGALAVSAMTLVASRRMGQRDATLSGLAIAVEHGMPLTSAIEALADQERGRARRRLLTLTRLLHDGAPLHQAAQLVPGALPRAATVPIGVGWTSGRLEGALREAAGIDKPGRALGLEIARRLVHLLAVLFITKLIVAFLLYFILPKFEAIFLDFGVELPQVTRGVIQTSHWLTSWGLPILLGMTACELALAVLLPFWLTDWLGLNLFGLDYLFRSRHTAPVLRALAWVVEGGKPLEAGVASLIRFYPSGWVQKRLLQALHDLGRGADFWQALRDRSLIGPADAAILDAAKRAGNLPWALRETAHGAARRSLARVQWWVTILSTVAIVALGVSVLILVTAFFVPLVTIIERIAG